MELRIERIQTVLKDGGKAQMTLDIGGPGRTHDGRLSLSNRRVTWRPDGRQTKYSVSLREIIDWLRDRENHR